MRLQVRQGADARDEQRWHRKHSLPSWSEGQLMDVTGLVRPDPSQQRAAWPVAVLGLALKER